MTIVWWKSFCGNRSRYDAFWDDDLSINTDTPDLTNCFQHSILTWFPCIALWSSSLCVFYNYRRRKNIPKRFFIRSKENIAKIVIGCLLSISVLARLCGYIIKYMSGDHYPPVQFVAATVRLLTMVLATVMADRDYQKGIHTSGALTIFWFLSTACGAVTFRSILLQRSTDEVFGSDLFSHVMFYTYFVFVAFELLLNLIPDPSANKKRRHKLSNTDEKTPLIDDCDHEDKDLKPSPEVSATFLSLITWTWFVGFLVRGYRKTVVNEDLYSLPEYEKSDTIHRDFNNTWSKSTSKKRNKRPSLLMVLLQNSWQSLLVANLSRLVCILTAIVAPFILRTLIVYMNIPNSYAWQGIFLCVTNYVVGVLQTLVVNVFYYYACIAGIRYRSMVTSAVYRKALLISSYTRRSTTVGQIVNLVSVDAQKLQDWPLYFELNWSVPLSTVVMVFCLSGVVGTVPALAGLAVLVVVIPFNALVLGRQIVKYQVKQMLKKDDRTKAIADIFSGIKVIKLYAWEPSFEQKVEGMRRRELSFIRVASNLAVFTTSSSFMMSYLVSLVVFATYTLTSSDHVLTADKAFVALSFVNVITYSLMLLPQGISITAQALVSVSRINKFLLLDEIDEGAVKREKEKDKVLSINDADLTWSPDEAPLFKQISISAELGQLIAVVGPVGSGKSSLLAALCGEMQILHGEVNVAGKIAYVSQQAWLQNMTLRDNILFGKNFHKNVYQKIIQSCALIPDLKILPDGDNTEIGEKGLNMSGGQKQRVSLARAVYANCDVYFLDDPLSAVDVHVGQHLFKYVIGKKGVLANKTRILVTHNVQLLERVDLIVVLDRCRVSEVGTYDELLTKDGAFADFVRSYLYEETGEYSTDSDVTEIKRRLAVLSEGESSADTRSRVIARQRKRQISNTEYIKPQISMEKKGRLIQEEDADVGAASFSVLRTYIQSAGVLYFLLTVVFFVLFVTSIVCTDLWLNEWSSDSQFNVTVARDRNNYRLGVYAAFVVCQAISWGIVCWAISEGSVIAASNLHKRLLNRVLKAPMSFFDTTPIGRLLNRFGKDMDTLDSDIRHCITIWINNMAVIFAAIVETSYTTPLFLAMSVPLLLIFLLLQRIYTVTSNQVTRMDSIRKSPIYAYFDECLNGVTSIRAFKVQNRFTARADALVDYSQQARYHVIHAQRCISIITQTFGTTFAFAASLFAVVQKSTISGALAGMSISKSLEMTRSLSSATHYTGLLENYIVSVERIREYIGINIEAPRVVETMRPLGEWPEWGTVEFRNYSTRYREGLDLVLKNLNFTVRSGQKIGIVGRTGAGKSSIALSLFRLIEPAEGAILVDGVDISTIGLHDLRSRIGIIPQDPVLFTGSLRLNLDPCSAYSDLDLWQALRNAHLHSFVSAAPAGLDYECGDGGEALSVGQRQLVCLARALLRGAQILVLDEATAAVDLETDELIQTTIRSQFKYSTVITIAHRVNTIMDYDRICVLDKGTVREMGPPSQLLANTNSVFYGMARDAGCV